VRARAAATAAARTPSPRAPTAPPPQALPAAALAPKVACDFRDPLCSLRARYAAGCAVLGGRAVCAGGLDANAPTYPLQGPELEAVDVAGLSPHVLQAAPDAALNTTRYRQQLLAWGDGRLLMVGGQFDDANGSSQKTMSMVVFDLAARGWSLLQQFWQSNQGERRRGAAGPACCGGGGQTQRQPRHAPAAIDSPIAGLPRIAREVLLTSLLPQIPNCKHSRADLELGWDLWQHFVHGNGGLWGHGHRP
jgi:hypothetical protein